MSRNEPEAYERGWRACMRGEDGRFANPYGPSQERIAWDAGFLDAMEAEDGEEARRRWGGIRRGGVMNRYRRYHVRPDGTLDPLDGARMGDGSCDALSRADFLGMLNEWNRTAVEQWLYSKDRPRFLYVAE